MIDVEAKPLSIGEKERPVATFGCGNRHCFGLIERPFVELFRRPGRAGEDQHLAIGRESHCGVMGTAHAVVGQMLGGSQFQRGRDRSRGDGFRARSPFTNEQHCDREKQNAGDRGPNDWRAPEQRQGNRRLFSDILYRYPCFADIAETLAGVYRDNGQEDANARRRTGGN